MPAIFRCPNCGVRFDPPRDEVSKCPECGLWFHKWRAVPGWAVEPAQEDRWIGGPPVQATDRLSYAGRAFALLCAAIWGLRLAAMDYRDAEINGSFMHNIVLPIHEAGHVFFSPFGEFMMVLGGSLFQVAVPLAIGAAFLWRQRDAFGAAMGLWWAGASVVDVAPYIWDSLQPQLILIGGHTGEDGPHDWIYLLERLGAMKYAHRWGTTAHHVGTLMMVGGVLWGARWLWRQRRVIRKTDFS